MNPRASEKTGIDQARNEAVMAEQIDLLYRSGPVILINPVVALIVAALLWRIYPAWIVLGWLALIVAVFIARHLLERRFQHRKPAASEAGLWAHYYACGATAIGCLWGLLASVVFMTDNATFHVLAAFVLGGLVAGASMRHSAYLPALYGFAGAAVAPMVAALLAKGSLVSAGIGLLLTIFAAVLVAAARDNNRRIANLRIQINQAALTGDLQRTVRALTKEATDRERVATVLEENSERFRAIGDHAQDAIIIADADEKVVYWDPAAERIFGEAQRGPDGGIQRVHGTAQDVTARKQAEKQPQEEEAMFRILVEQGMAGIFIVAQDGTLAYFNPRFAEMIGGEFAVEGIGRPMLDLVGDADKEAMRETMKALFSGRQTSHEVPLTMLRKRGGAVNTIAQGSLATFEGKRAVIVVVLDISERQQSDTEIATLHEKMTATVVQLRQHEQDREAIAKLSDILQSCHTRTEAYPIIAMSAGNLFPGMNGALALVADETHDMETIAQWGAEQPTLERFSFDACWALRTGQRYEVSDPDHGTLCRHFKSAPGGPYVCLPLMVHGEMSGMLHLEVPPDRDIDDELRQLMLTIGDVVKLSLSNLKLRESLSELAMRDELTGLFNRHYLTETLPRELHRAARSKAALTIAIMDVDHFKTFNDTQGHDAGDEVLRQLGAFLQHSVRSGDIACRYGGEELLLVLPDCDSGNAKTRLEHLCKEIREKAFLFRGNALPSVTLSVGLAQLSEDLPSAETLITAADEALYRAKHNGRNRVEVFARKPPRKARAPKA